MLRALGGARVANLGAQLAQALRPRAPAAHEGGRQAADVRAVAIEANALHHVLDVGLFQAGRGALFARSRAPLTRLETGTEIVLVHVVLRFVDRPTCSDCRATDGIGK